MNLVPSAINIPAAKANVNVVSAKAIVPSAKRQFVPKAFVPTATAKAVVEIPSSESAASESRVLFDASAQRSSLEENAPISGAYSSPSAVLSAADEDISPLKTPSVPPAPKSGFAAKWNRWTQRLTDFAAVPFLALQIPQIISNVTNLVGGHAEQLANLPWMGYSTGILGNMLLLSWFAGQKETSAARVQAIGVATSAVVVVQIFLAGFMPGAAFVGVLGAVAAGLTLNWLKFKDKAPAGAWSFWTKASSLLGLVVLPQVLWTTFAPAAAFSYLPGLLAGGAALTMMALESRGKLPARLQGVWSSLAAWTATLLFMYGPIAQLMANHANPAGMAGLSVGTMLLAMAGNLLMLPRAMLTKNVVWFTGSAWGVVVGGWAVMLGMYLGGFVAAPLFFAVSGFVPLYLLTAHFLNRADRGFFERPAKTGLQPDQNEPGPGKRLLGGVLAVGAVAAVVAGSALIVGGFTLYGVLALGLTGLLLAGALPMIRARKALSGTLAIAAVLGAAPAAFVAFFALTGLAPMVSGAVVAGAVLAGVVFALARRNAETGLGAVHAGARFSVALLLTGLVVTGGLGIFSAIVAGAGAIFLGLRAFRAGGTGVFDNPSVTDLRRESTLLLAGLAILGGAAGLSAGGGLIDGLLLAGAALTAWYAGRPLPRAESSGANLRAPSRFNWRVFGFSVGGAAVVGLGIAAAFAAFSPIVWPFLLVFFGAGTPLYAAIFHALKARFGRGEPSVVPSITAAVGVQMAVFSILAAAGISTLGLAGVLAVTAALIAQAALVRPREGFAGTADFLGSLIMLGVSLVGLAGMVFVIGGMSVLGGVLLGVAGLAAGYAALAHLRENKR